jgi:cell division protein ZapE
VQGEADPLAVIARERARRTRLLCLDEFHITDITDAMLMRRLIEVLLENGVVLVTTSNFEPDSLYLHGLQRVQFLPAIELIKEKLDVVNVDEGTDYRLRELEQAGVYHTGADADRALKHAFMHIAGDAGSGAASLEVEGRMIDVKCEARGVAWFDFSELCETARGKDDYIELARRYQSVLVSDVPRFTAANADSLRRFVWMIDEFYDRRVKLIVSAAAPPEALIFEGDGDDRFQANLNASLRERLVSRLTEMHTRDYLSQAHLP